jgi:hypothetical protein
MSEYYPNLENKEVLPPQQEVAQERSLCLDSLIAQIEDRYDSRSGLKADAFLVGAIDDAVIKFRGNRQWLECQQPGCDAWAMVDRITGVHGLLNMVFSNPLKRCIEQE